MPGDRKQPRCERLAAAAVAPDTLDGLEEDLGSDVLGERTVAELGERRAEDEAVVLFEQLCPGGGVPLAKCLQLLFIGGRVAQPGLGLHEGNARNVCSLMHHWQRSVSAASKDTAL